MPQTMTLADILTRLTREGELYEKLPDQRLRCYACGHRCMIPEGRPGVCKVRFNRGGVLYVPAGYVGVLQCDPVEKKPFFHALPGSLALSFGMLGCDYHCGYCFDGDVRVPTTNGMVPIQRLFDESPRKTEFGDGIVGTGIEELTYGSDGNDRRIAKAFRHPYRGPLLTINPKHLLPLRCTPEHPILASLGDQRSSRLEPQSFVNARDLTLAHWLCIPRGSAVSWHPGGRQGCQYREGDNFYYLPIDSISSHPFQGYVYNLEVDGDHTYLANGIATHNCQNWVTSQAIRDPKAVSPPELVSPDYLVGAAEHYGAPIIASTYNEPLITSEWAVEVFRLAKQQGLKTAYISNGNGTPQVIEYLKPWVDLYKVDLKGFNDLNYRKLGGVLGNVLDTIKLLVEKQFWVEIVTLVVPGFNDSDAELTEIAEFLASVSLDLPWHVTAFHQDYKMQDRANTAAGSLLRAAEIGKRAGLRFVYAGNLPGRVGTYENTCCPSCQTLLIERYGYTILKNVLEDGACPTCHVPIPGVWD